MSDDCIGIIAGSGNLAREIITSCKLSGNPFFVLAFEGQTDPDLLHGVSHAWTRLGSVSENLQLLRQANVTRIVMAGRFRRPSWRELKPDILGARWIARMAGHAFGDDSLLKHIINLLEEEGFTVISPESISSSGLFVARGILGSIKPDDTALNDISRGKEILEAISSVDIGQAVVIQQGLTLGVEAVEGTNELIQRCRHYRREGSKPVLVKMCKQGQETRADRATVGLETLAHLAKSGYAGLAVGAESVIVLDQESFFRQANEAGLFVMGI